MPTEHATPENPHSSQGDRFIPPTMGAHHSSQARTQAAEKDPRRAGLRAYLVLIVLTLLAFGPMLQSDFLWSEYDEVERTAFTSMQGWAEAWDIESIRRHDPLTITTYFLESYLPFPQPTAHRGINLVLHLLAALLLLKTLEHLKLRGAFAAALVFALHPAVLQTLFWPGYRTEVVGLVFILASLYFGIRNRSLSDYLVALALALIGSLLHPAALVIPGLLGLVIFFKSSGFHLYHYNRILPFFCIALFAGAWTHSGQPPETTPEELNFLSTVAQNLNFHLHHSLLPLDLGLFNEFSQQRTYNVGAATSVVAFLIFLPFYLLIAFNHRKHWARGVFLGLSSFLLLSLYGMVQTGRFIDGSLAKEDHTLYVALPAIIALVFCSIAGFFGQKKTFGPILWPAGFSFFLLIHIGVTASYSYALRDSTQMWQALAEDWKDSWQPRAALVESVQANDSDLLSESEMIRTLEELLEANPQRHRERILLARTYRAAKQRTNALREYRQILRETQPTDKFLQEAADFFDSLDLQWEADKVRQRIDNSRKSKG